MIFDGVVFKEPSIPQISAVVSGKNTIYDPRDGTRKFTNNWALVIRDYLTDPAGFNASDAEIDDASFIAAANISDELVGGLPRYTINGVINTSDQPINVLRDLEAAGMGHVRYSNGKYGLIPGAWTAPVALFDESDLAGEIVMTGAVSRRDIYNTITGTFLDETSWTVKDIPEQSNASYIAQDGGDKITQDVEFPFVTNQSVAVRLASVTLAQSRQRVRATMTLKVNAVMLQAGDVIRLNMPAMGWADKTFRVQSVGVGQNFNITVEVIEETSAVWGA
jgi:hypothetical protein